MEFYARPDQLLVEHLKNVAKNVERIFEDIQISEKTLIKNIATISAYFHDFGKYTSYFQDKLNGKNHGGLSRHSYISALVCATFLRRNLPQAGSYILSSFMSIVAHHSDLPDFKELIPNLPRLPQKNIEGIRYFVRNPRIVENLSVVAKQLEDLRKNLKVIMKEYQSLGIELDESYFNQETIVETIKYLRSMYNKDLLYNLEDEEKKKRTAFITQLLFSVLIDADKKDAAGFVDSERVEIPEDLVERYLKNFEYEPNSKMNHIRNLLRDSVVKSVEQMKIEDVKEKVLTITAPTGSGKTLTALSAALKLREKIKKEKGYTPRIIYSLPYISIIEQTLKVIGSVLDQIPNYKNNQSRYFITHYHLAENIKEVKEDKIDYSTIDKINLLVESWDSEIILTTFWQLLHTILGYRNRLMKKFYKLSGSIVILDEVQTIPAEHWKIIERFLESLSSQFSTLFIFITATQPMLLKEKSVELNKHVEVIFKDLERTKILDLTDVDDFQEVLSEIYPEVAVKNTLFVFNTVSDSIRKYRILKQFEKEIYYLSTNITPKDRFERLEEIRKAIEDRKKKVTVVSTQVIEAGVDLDFDLVVREIAPLHSIIQVAGRCNRNYRRKQLAKMYLVNTNENAAKIVYKTVHIRVVKEMIAKYLKAKGEVSEKEYLNLVREYFEIIKQRAAKSDELDEIWRSFLELKFKGDETTPALSDYRVIDYRPDVTIFVMKNEEDEKVFEIFRRILNSEDPFERKILFNLNKRKIEERLLHVYVERALRNLPPSVDYIDSVRFIDRDNLETYYDLETGFRYTDEEINTGVIW